MPDNKKIPMTVEEREDAIQTIRTLHSQTGFLAQLLDADAVGESEAITHMSLMRHSYDDLAALLRTDPISKDLEQAHAMCREANERVREMESRLGQSVTADAAMSKLKTLEEWFAAWWELSGFHYMQISWLQWGIQFESSDDIDHPNIQPGDITFGDKELALQAAPVVPYLFHGIDVRKDTYHDELLLTSGNVAKLQERILAAFPNFRLTGCSSHVDGSDLLLRLNGIVPWTDIEKWRDRVLAEAAKLPPRNTGKYFVELSTLERRMANKTANKDWPKDILMQQRKRLNYLRTVCGLWTRIQDACGEDTRTGNDLDLVWSMGGKAYNKFFKSGTEYDMMAAWIAKEFALDVTRDLTGSLSGNEDTGSN